MDSFLMHFSICCCLFVSTDGVTLTLEIKSILPLKGSSLELSCKISEPFNSNGIVVWKGTSQVTLCYGDSYLCDFYKSGYSFTTNSTVVFGRISNLTAEDEGTWRCSYRTFVGDIYSNSWNVTVYTIPSGLSITQDPNQNVDLSVQSAVLQCKTIGCTYPMPRVLWIFQDLTTSSENVYATNFLAGTQEMCVTKEKIYTSTLNLPLYTTLNDNADKTGTFSCRIEYNDSSRNIIAYASNTVRFAVRVTEAVLQQNNQNITEILTVTSAEPVTLTCVTGNCRPAPTINWHIGSQKRGSGPNLTITFSNMDHDGTIYCQAYNTDPSRLVYSAKPRLFVRVRVTEVVLQQNNQNITEILTVTSAEPVTLTCVTGTSRPAPTIDWYTGSQKRGSGSSLIITFSITDHNETINCQAYNIDPSKPVSSSKPRLFVRVTPEKPINFHATNIQDKQLSLMWQSGYNGRLTQTFVVERSLDNITWNNVSEVSAGNRDGWFSTDIGDLIPGTEYYLRLYAYNIYGRGDFADVQLVIKMLKECASSLEVSASVGISVGGIVGAGVGGIVVGLIGAIIAFTIRRQLNGPKNSCFKSKRKTDDAMQTYSNTEMNPQTEKPIYEELNKGNTERSVYDKISPL